MSDFNSENGKIMVCFLPSSSELLEKSILNTLAARFAPTNKDNRDPMVHVELFFPTARANDAMLGHSCGIHYGGKVFCAPKRFSKRNWLFRTIPVNKQQYEKLLHFCKAQENGKFNYAGYYAPCSLVPRAHRLQEPLIHQQSWYCSELASSALEYAGILEQGGDSYTHPDRLYENIKDVCHTQIAQEAWVIPFLIYDVRLLSSIWCLEHASKTCCGFRPPRCVADDCFARMQRCVRCTR